MGGLGANKNKKWSKANDKYQKSKQFSERIKRLNNAKRLKQEAFKMTQSKLQENQPEVKYG